MSIWKFCLSEDYSYSTGIAVQHDKVFYDQDNKARLRITRDGTITILKSYSWDGCTPKIKFFDLFYIGTPDGTLNKKTGKPKAYYASLVHDALYQFLDSEDMPYSRQVADHIFYELLKESKFSLGFVYFMAVRMCGGLFQSLSSFIK